MAERVVNDFQRVLGLTAGFALAELHVGQFALDQIDQAAVHLHGRRRSLASAVVGERGNVGVLGFEMAQHVLQAFFDPSEIAGAVVRRRLETFQQIGYALFEMGQRRRAVIADLHMVETVHQRPQGAFDMFRIVADHGPFAALQRRGQGRDALFQHREGIAAAFGAGELVDLG